VPRRLKIAGLILLFAVLIGAIYVPRLRDRLRRLREAGRSEEQARRELIQPSIATPTDVKVNAKIYWASTLSPATLEPVEVQLPLSASPVQRAKQLLDTLITSPPSPEQRTLPADATLVEFYLLRDGTAVADFSDALATATPSGILSEQLAVDSIVKTLAANVAAVNRLKILIHGQEVETLAGHVDLTGIFAVRVNPSSTTPANPAASATPTAPGKVPAGRLTPPAAPGKLGR
jgi:sporulation and spore germination protein